MLPKSPWYDNIIILGLLVNVKKMTIKYKLIFFKLVLLKNIKRKIA